MTYEFVRRQRKLLYLCVNIALWPDYGIHMKSNGHKVSVVNLAIHKGVKWPLCKLHVYVSCSIVSAQILYQEAMGIILNDLNDGDVFNIVRFDDSASLWQDSSKASTEANKKKAIRFVNDLSADDGNIL